MNGGDLKLANARLTQAMRARPSCNSAMPYLGVRSRLQLAKVYSVTGDHATARHLLREIDDIVLRRPALGALIDAVSELRRIATTSPQAGAAGTLPLTAAELGRFRISRRTSRVARSPSACSCPAAPSTPRSARLSEARCLQAQRRRATSDDDRSPRRISGAHTPTRTRTHRRSRTPTPTPVWGPPQRRTEARRCEQHRRGRRRSQRPWHRRHCSVGLRPVRGHGTTHRDQRAQTDERQRLRVEFPSRYVGALPVVLRPAFVVDRQTTQAFCVVHSIHPAAPSLGPAARRRTDPTGPPSPFGVVTNSRRMAGTLVRVDGHGSLPSVMSGRSTGGRPATASYVANPRAACRPAHGPLASMPVTPRA